jgi:transketolase
MKKVVCILLSLTTTLLLADEKPSYEIYFSKTKNIELKEAKKTEVFFGEFNDFKEKQSEEIKTLAKNLGNGLSSGLSATANAVSKSAVNSSGQALGQGSIMGLGIGLFYAGLEVGYNKYKENQYNTFILVNDYENEQGEKSRVLTFFKSDNLKDEKVIKDLLIEETNKNI